MEADEEYKEFGCYKLTEGQPIHGHLQKELDAIRTVTKFFGRKEMNQSIATGAVTFNEKNTLGGDDLIESLDRRTVNHIFENITLSYYLFLQV